MENNVDKKNNDNKLSKRAMVIAIVLLLISIVLPPIVNLLLYLPIPTAAELTNKEWLAFWGSYLGGVIGGVCTLLTIIITLHYYEKQDAEHKQELDKQNKIHQEELQLQQIMQFKPKLFLQPIGGTGTEGKYATFNLRVTNVGAYAIINFNVDDHYIDKIVPGDTGVIALNSNDGNFNSMLHVSAFDIIGNQYSWYYTLKKIPDVIDKNGKKITPCYYEINTETPSY